MKFHKDERVLRDAYSISGYGTVLVGLSLRRLFAVLAPSPAISAL